MKRERKKNKMYQVNTINNKLNDFHCNILCTEIQSIYALLKNKGEMIFCGECKEIVKYKLSAVLVFVETCRTTSTVRL